MDHDVLSAAPRVIPIPLDDIRIIPDPPSARASHIRLDIQGLRCVAVLAVIAYHANRRWLPGGWTGVDVFFVISGYVIAGVLQRSTSRTPLRDFYSRRVRRLMPPAALMVSVTLIAALFIVPFGVHLPIARSAEAAALSSSNIRFILVGHNYFAPNNASNPFLHTWSLGVEEQFYFAIPPLYFALRKVGRRWLRPMFTILGVLSLVLCVAATKDGLIMIGSYRLHTADVAFYSPATRAWEFLAGFVVAGVAVTGWEPVAGVVRGAAVIALGGCLVLFSDAAPFPGWRALAPVIATVALLATGQAARTPILSWRPLVAIGDISYGLYLWHWPALVLSRCVFASSVVAVAVALAATVPLAVLSYQLVEVKARSGQRWSVWRSSVAAAASVALPFGLAVVLMTVSPILARARHVDHPPQLGFGGVFDATCTEIGADLSWDRARCSWGPEPRVFLVGDSHAIAIGPMVASAAQANGLGFATLVRHGCPVSLAVAVDPIGCAEWQAKIVETVIREQPALVVISNRSTAYTRAPGETLDVRLPGRRVPRTEDDALTVWDQGLRPVLTQFAQAGIPVLVFGNVPEFPYGPDERVSFIHPDGRIMAPIALADVRARNDRVQAVEQQAVSATPGAALFDPVPYLCDPVCRQWNDGTWLYFDDDHLAPGGAERTSTPFAAAVRAAVSG